MTRPVIAPTPAMIGRIKELATPARDDFDRAVLCVVTDYERFQSIIGSTLSELNEAITQARGDATLSHKAAMNSYGAGYDSGYAAGLERAKLIVAGEEEPEANFPFSGSF